MFGISKDPSNGNVNVSPLNSVKNEPIVKEEVCSPEGKKSSYNQLTDCETSLYHFPCTDVKIEVLEDASISGDEGSVCRGRSPLTAACTKQDLDIGPTELQPPDVHFMPRSCKPDPDDHKPLWVTVDFPHGHKMFEGEHVNRQQDRDLLMLNSPKRLPQGTPVTQAHRVNTVQQPDRTTQTNLNTIKLLDHAPRISAPLVHQDTSHRGYIYSITSKSYEDNPSNRKKKFECDCCHKLFSWKSNLLDHMPLHKELLPSQFSIELSQCKIGDISARNKFECNSCHKMFLRKSKLISHFKFCGETFSQSSNFYTHMGVHTGEKLFECRICRMRYRHRLDLSTHMQVHMGENPFECKHCGIKYNRCSALSTHMQAHTYERPFECKICGIRYSRISDLTIHMRVHSGEKPFECRICSIRYSLSSDLTTHMRVHTCEKPFECRICGIRYSRNSDLTIHMRVHTGEKPYGCRICGIRYGRSSDLTTHMRVHTGERPYECRTCGKRYSRSLDLTIHMQVHTGEKPFKCKICSTSYSRSSDLTRHMRVHTGILKPNLAVKDIIKSQP